MKICHFVTNSYSFDTRVKKECEALVESGLDVCCVGFHREDLPNQEILNGVRVIRCPMGWKLFNDWLRSKIGSNKRMFDCWKYLKFIMKWLSILGNIVLRIGQYSKTIFELARMREYRLWPKLVSSLIRVRRPIPAQSSNLADEEQLKEWIRTQNDFGFRDHLRFWCDAALLIFLAPFVLILTLLGIFFRWIFLIIGAVASHSVHLITAIAPRGISRNLQMVLIGLTQNADIYQANDFDTLAIGWLCAKTRGAFLVYDSHELYDESFPRRKPFHKRYLIRLLEGHIIHRCDKIITVCHSLADILRERYRLVEKPVVVYNSQPYESSITPNNYVLEHIHLQPDELICIYAGRITSGRGLAELAAVSTHIQGVHVVFMGNVDLAFTDTLSELMQTYGHSGYFHVLPPVPSEELPGVLSVCDIGVAAVNTACLSYYYGIGNKVFHYMNSGLAFLTVNHPEKRSIVEKYKNGAFVHRLTTEFLTEKILSFRNDPEKLSKMKKRSRQAAAEMSWEKDCAKYVRAYLDIYESALFEEQVKPQHLFLGHKLWLVLRGFWYEAITLATR